MVQNMKDVDVSIIFVNYKTPNMTLNAIESVMAKTKRISFEIIVVDNSNDDEEYKELEKLISSKAILINPEENLGFGKANNAGSLIANGKYLFFLNTDTLLMNNAIYELFLFMEANSRCGIAGCNLYASDGSPAHSFSYDEVNIAQQKKEYSLFRSFTKKITRNGNEFNYTGKPLKINGYVCGASLMVRKELFDALGGFDKEIFMYAEETLLCYRMKHELGYEIYNVPTSNIIHFEGGTIKNKSEFQLKCVIDGKYIYFKKAYGEKIAKKYLLVMDKIFKRRIFLTKFIMKSKHKEQVIMKKVLEKKCENVK